MLSNSVPVGRVRIRAIPDPTEYIFNQEEADEQLKTLLILIKKWHLHFQMDNDRDFHKLSQSI